MTGRLMLGEKGERAKESRDRMYGLRIPRRHQLLAMWAPYLKIACPVHGVCNFPRGELLQKCNSVERSHSSLVQKKKKVYCYSEPGAHKLFKKQINYKHCGFSLKPKQ